MNEKLQVTYVYPAVEEEQLTFTPGVTRNVTVPGNDGHVFEIGYGGTRNAFSMCGKEEAQIGERVLERKVRAKGVRMCPDCLEAWKKHPQSEYAQWVEPTRIGSMSPEKGTNVT